MSDWKQRPSGLLVPAFPQRTPMSSLPAGWDPPKPERRIYTRQGPRPVDPVPGSWSTRDLHEHVRGRAEATARILLGTAVLKHRLSIWNYVVSWTGAVWQDWEGSSAESQRAHRAPCNPTIGNSNIPDLARGPGLRNALIEPLAKTDFLPMIANYADSRFESLGGAKTLADAVGFVAREQRRDKTVDYDLFHHALSVALGGYGRAYEAVFTEIRERLNREGPVQLQTRIDNHNPNAPTHNFEDALEAAYDLKRFTTSATSDLLHSIPFKAEVERLNDLASSSAPPAST